MGDRTAALPLGWALALAAACAHAPARPTDAPEFVRRWEERMYTRFSVTLPAGPGAEEAFAEVFKIVAEVEATANEWRPGSPLAAVNQQAGGAPVPIPPGLVALLQRGVALGEATGGAFDITWAALWGLWDFNQSPPHPPEPEAIAARLPLIDYRRVEIDASAGTARLPQVGMLIGLGGIAKGYALDEAAAALRRRGYEDFLLEGGGQMLAAGDHGDRPWKVGLRDPRGAPDDVFATLTLRDASVSTSGDYERYFEHEGVRYHHILDPRTGWPTVGTRAVAVVAADGTTADALSTALMVAGPERGLALVESLGAAAVIVDAAGALWVSPTLTPQLSQLHPPLAAGAAASSPHSAPPAPPHEGGTP